MSNEIDRPARFQPRYMRRWRAVGETSRASRPGAVASTDRESVDLTDVSDSPCLVLLGEPGAGKTYELRRLLEKLRERGERTVYISGRDIGGGDDPRGPLLTDDQGGQAADGSPLHLLIDGVDEIGSGGDGQAAHLEALLDRLGAGRGVAQSPRVAMTCRTAAWSEALDQLVVERWGAGVVMRLALVPLDEFAIGIGVAQVEPDGARADQLAGLLVDESLRSIAGRPLLLAMLLERYASDGVLPPGQVALFRDAVETFLGQGMGGGVPADVSRRSILAARLAAASTFSGIGRLATPLASDVAECLLVNRIAGGTEPSARGSFAVIPADLAAVLESDLFITVDRGVYEFRDRIFREFLTARYLVEHRLSPEQVMSLLAVQEVDGPGGVAPQLQEVAAWAAAMMPVLFELLMAREPQILLKSDVAAMKPVDRARLTAAVLDRFASDDLLDQREALVPLFARLDHPDLADQIEAIVTDASAPVGQRMVAVDVGVMTAKASLVPALLRVAQDESADALLRTWAARAVGSLGSDDDLDALAPILSTDLLTDREDRLRGALLRLCWPAHLEFHELLNALTPPRQRNHIGSYYLFLRQLKFEFVTPEMAAQAIEWLRSRIVLAGREERGLQEVMSRLFWATAAMIGFEEVRSGFADLVVEAEADIPRLLSRGRDAGENWSAQTGARSALVAEALARSPDPVRTTSVLLHFLPDLVRPEDVDEYLRLLAKAEVSLAPSLSQIVVALCDRRPIDGLTHVWDVADGVPELQALLARRYTVDLSSEAVEWMRRHAAEAPVPEGEGDQADVVDTRIREGVLSLLDRIERGRADLWWRLNHELMRDASGHRSEYEFMSDLTVEPGWRLLDPDTRRRVIATAATYLVEAPLVDTSWLGTTTSNRPANAGVRALRLLREQAPQVFATLPDATWEAWTPALIGFSDNDADQAGALRELASEAWRHAPDAVLGAIRTIALDPKSEGLGTQTLELIEGLRQPAMVGLLEELRQEPSLRGKDARSAILSLLLRMGVDDAVREVLGGLEGRGVGGNASELLARAGAELLLAGSVKAWGLLLQLRERDPAMATAVWRELAGKAGFRPLPIVEELDAWSIAQAYVDLAELLPERPPTLAEVRVVGVPDHVERLRSVLVARLVTMGTNAALQQLERIAGSIDGGRDALRWSIGEARRNVRARAALRPDPSDVLMQIRAMGIVAGESESLPAQPAPAFVDDAEGVPIEEDLRVPEPKPAGPLAGDQRRAILAVATEWSSASGGISTLNRELCKALAALGHAVTCLVPRASAAEVQSAREVGVMLTPCPVAEGIDEEFGFLLCGVRELGSRPQIVIGHDHITGPFGRALADRFDAKYVHFLHTIPMENEGLKGDRGDKRRPLLSGEDKFRAQNRLAALSDLVVAVGPRIRRTFRHQATGVGKVVTLIPGLDEHLLTLQPEGGEWLVNQCLMVGRMEDASVKGIHLACDVMKLVVEENRWPSGQTPKLCIRGFSWEHADVEIEVVEDYKSKYGRFVFPRGYSTDAEELRTELERSGLFVMPSVAEGFGLTGYEAIAAGIPVLISAESGLAEFLSDEASGGVLNAALIEPCVASVASTPERNVTEWRQKVEAVLSDRATAFLRADRIRKALGARYRWDSAARSLSDEIGRL